MQFAYLILSGKDDPANPTAPPTWVGSDGNSYGNQLPHIMQTLGQQGWELVCGVDVVRSSRSELFFKKQV